LRTPHRVMGVDLALQSTGVSILDTTGAVVKMVTLKHPMKRRKPSDGPVSSEVRIARLVTLADELVALAADFNVGHVAVEGFAFSRGFQAHQLGEAQGAMKVEMWRRRKTVVETAPMSSARLELFGYGLAQKDVIRTLLGEAGIATSNDHEADAFVAAWWMFMQASGVQNG
jgi:Holliday junction resolvasome RuvABC endonuclease subunit